MNWFVARFCVRNGAIFRILKLSYYKSDFLTETPISYTFIVMKQHNFPRIANLDVYGVRRRRKHQGNVCRTTRALRPNPIQFLGLVPPTK